MNMKTIDSNAQTLTFEQLNLHPDLLKALSQCEYTTPTPIQSQAIPHVLAGQDVIASAQTGTGKTAAFLLPALHHILTKPTQHKKPRILILSPTRELAQQIEKAAREYSRNIRMSSVCLVGGVPYPQQIKALSRPLDLIIATPGRLMDHLERNRVDLSAIELFVLDEADRMLDMGFVDDVELIASRCNKQRQTMLFSATIDRQMESLANALLKNPVRIKVEAERTNNRQIQQSVYLTDGMQHKTALLSHLLQQEPIFKGIIFTATKSSADNLADTLFEQGHKAAAMHGDMKQTRRNKTLEQLRSGRLQFIVATDVAARGIDINSITHVINFDMPRFAEDYVHRIGRTGRAGQSGCAISFAAHSERSCLQKIERYIGQPIKQLVIEGLEPKAKFERDKPKAKRSYGGGKSYANKPQGFGKKGPSRANATRGNSDRGRADGQPVAEGRFASRQSTEGREHVKSYARSERGNSGRGRADGQPMAEGRFASRPRTEGRAHVKSYANPERGSDRSRGDGQSAEGRFASRPRTEGRVHAKSHTKPYSAAPKKNSDRREERSAIKARTAKPRLSLKPKRAAND